MKLLMKLLRSIGLIFFMFSVSSAVSNWGGDITKNPVFVLTMLLVSIAIYAVADCLCD